MLDECTSNEEVIAATEAYFAEFDKAYFMYGLKKLEYRCTKCIELKGDYYVEFKSSSTFQIARILEAQSIWRFYRLIVYLSVMLC